MIPRRSTSSSCRARILRRSSAISTPSTGSWPSLRPSPQQRRDRCSVIAPVGAQLSVFVSPHRRVHTQSLQRGGSCSSALGAAVTGLASGALCAARSHKYAPTRVWESQRWRHLGHKAAQVEQVAVEALQLTLLSAARPQVSTFLRPQAPPSAPSPVQRPAARTLLAEPRLACARTWERCA